MASSLVRWFGSPEYARPDLQRRARALWMLSWPFFGVVAVVLGIAVLVEPHTAARRATTVAAVGVLIAVLHAINRTGRVILASWLLAIGLSVIVTQRAWITGGIHAPVAVFYALFIIMGGVLIGVRGGIVTAAVCVAGAMVLTAGTWLEWLAVPPGAGSPLGAFVFVLLAIGLALVLQTLVAFRPRREPIGAGAVQMLVHDMRSPMQVLIAQLELLREDLRGERAKDVEVALEGAVALNRMTNSLLDVSRIEQGQMPVQRSQTDLSALVTSVVDGIRILQPRRTFVIDAPPHSMCQCDPELTRRVIENLVSNAMKHTPVDGRVGLAVSMTSSRATLAVQDEGPGIAPEDRTRIFEPYSSEGIRSATGYTSSGLGLAFCKLAIEAQGGRIRVEDTTPRGSTFIVELPRR